MFGCPDTAECLVCSALLSSPPGLLVYKFSYFILLHIFNNIGKYVAVADIPIVNY